MSVVSQVWQTPVRHDQRTGTSHASASSSRLPYSSLHGTSRSLRAKAIVGPLPAGPAGGWGARVGVPAIPGVSPGAGPNGSGGTGGAPIPRPDKPAPDAALNRGRPPPKPLG